MTNTMTGNGTDPRWVRTRSPRPSARVNLVCLPHAGGSASYYRDWGAGLPETVETHVLQYPGREDRLADPLIVDMAGLADAVTDVLRPLFARPTVLFGHSMGASLLYEVVRRCQDDEHSPVALIVSGPAAPHRRDRRRVHESSDDDLVAEVARFSASTAEVLASPDLRELLLPVIRSDYRLIETYEPDPLFGVRAPLAVFRGEDDPDVDDDQARAWGELTESGEVTHQVFDGGHFYLAEHRAAVLSRTAEFISRTALTHET